MGRQFQFFLIVLAYIVISSYGQEVIRPKWKITHSTNWPDRKHPSDVFVLKKNNRKMDNVVPDLGVQTVPHPKETVTKPDEIAPHAVVQTVPHLEKTVTESNEPVTKSDTIVPDSDGIDPHTTETVKESDKAVTELGEIIVLYSDETATEFSQVTESNDAVGSTESNEPYRAIQSQSNSPENEHFAKALYDTLSPQMENMFFSPLSIHLLLSLMYTGSEGQTKDEFRELLKIPEPYIAAQQYGGILREFDENLEKSVGKGGNFSLTNKMFVQNCIDLNPEFAKNSTEKFRLEIDRLNFSDGQTSADTINEWVEEKTERLIKNIVTKDDFDCFTRMVLINAILLKSDWTIPFNRHLTHKEPFQNSDGTKTDVDMMQVIGNFKFGQLKDYDAQIVKLDLEVLNASMIIVMPNKAEEFKSFEKKLNGIDLFAIIPTTGDGIDLFFPKIAIESTMKMKPVLEQMGLRDAFSETNAKFGGVFMKDHLVSLGDIIQKTHLEVNEKGIIAAGVTVVGLLNRNLGPIQMKVNCSFMFYIVTMNQQYNNILFMGKVERL